MSLLKLTHSTQFVQRWKKVITQLYNYKEYKDFLIIPSLASKESYSYLPLLNYSDRNTENISDLLYIANNNFQIRALNFKYKNFIKNDTVSMRLDINKKNSQEVFSKSIKPRCRNKIRNSMKNNNFILKKGNDDKFIEDFYTIFSKSIHNHGIPVLDKKLFYNLRDEFKEDAFFYILYDKNKPIATISILLDEHIAWYPLGGIDKNYSKQLIGYLIYWKVLEDIIDNYNKKIFDFGRSPYLSNTFNFKSQFGAESVKIDIISNNKKDIYFEYRNHSNFWRKIPLNFANIIGPKICRYCVDF